MLKLTREWLREELILLLLIMILLKLLGIKIVKGRDFQQDMPSDTLTGVIVNETFVKRMGWAEPIGKKVEAGDANQLRARVIGVMQDYHQTGMYNEIESLLLAYRIRNNIVYIKLSGNDIKQTLSYIETKWKEVFPVSLTHIHF